MFAMSGNVANHFLVWRTYGNPDTAAVGYVELSERWLDVSHLVCKEDSPDCLTDSPWWTLARSWTARSCPKYTVIKEMAKQAKRPHECLCL